MADLPNRVETVSDDNAAYVELDVARVRVNGKVLEQRRYLESVDDAMTLVAAVEAKHGRPFNLVTAMAYGSAYICPCDGQSYGINDPLKGEGRVQHPDLRKRMARAITAACLRSLEHPRSIKRSHRAEGKNFID